MLKEGYETLNSAGECEKKLVRYCPGNGRAKETVWTPEQLITAFKDLTRISFSASTARILRINALEKVDRPKYSFAPKISPRSQILAEGELRKFLETSMSDQHVQSIASEFHSVDDDIDCNVHEIADERDYSLDDKIDPLRSKSIEEESRCSPSTSISMSDRLGTRIRLLYDKRRRSLDKLEQIRAEERRKLRKVCPFKPKISSSYRSRQNSVSSTCAAGVSGAQVVPIIS